MSRILFWYIFRNLISVFLLTSGALAAIMSFGGLLRPLTEHGLGPAQAAQMLGWFMPAMNTYALPVAALFATTMVYGRLSADNELTACRAAGMSYLMIALPAFVLGLLISIISFVLLYFVVPSCTLKVEKIIYSNLAQLVSNQIQRNHRITLDTGKTPVTVFAQSAELLDARDGDKAEQVVRLTSPLFVQYARGEKIDKKYPPPEEFFMARVATAHITQNESTGEVFLRATLEGGLKFPRNRRAQSNALQVSVENTEFFSPPMESPVRENTKFMALERLRHLLEHPEDSRRMKKALAEFVRDDQEQQFLEALADSLNSPAGLVELGFGNESYVLERGWATAVVIDGRLTLGSVQQTVDPPPRLTQKRADGTGLDVVAKEVRIHAIPDAPNQNSGSTRRVYLEIELHDALVRVGETASPRSIFRRAFSVPMPVELLGLENRTIVHYINTAKASPDRQSRLQRDWYRLKNSIISEMNARASFSISCLILVLVGCALGMMFKSGNFLTAFALSVVPALICILLIITGQHTCENIPWEMAGFKDPLRFGITMIWTGNIVVGALALALLGRLQRQ